MNKKLPVAFIIDNNFVVPCIVAITSILLSKNTGVDYKFYILVNDISNDNLKKINELNFEPWNAEIVIVNLDLAKYKDIYIHYDGNIGAGSITALAKFDLHNLIDESKVLYLDSDIIVQNDISELFEISLEDKIAYVVRDSGKIYNNSGLRGKLPKYFNSGVMLLNLSQMRENDFTTKLINAKKSLNDDGLVDQDAFNIAFRGLTGLLPIKYNALMLNLHNSVGKYSIEKLNSFYETSYSCLYDLEEDVSIIHFASKEKPWLYNDVHYSDLWINVYNRSLLGKVKLERKRYHSVEFHKEQIVPVILATDANYLPQTLVTIVSALENRNSEAVYKFYILTPNKLEGKETYLFKELNAKYTNHSIEFIVMGNAFADAKLNIAHITSPTFYRLNAPSLFPQYDKIIYLDSDVIVEGDLTTYYSLDLDGYYVAGVKAASYHSARNGNKIYCENNGLPAIDQYINAGVILLNLRELRKDDIEKDFIYRAKQGYRSQDQDVINGACYGHIKLISYKWNCMITKYEINQKQLLNCFTMEEINEAHNRPEIIHYAAEEKPWKSFDCALSDRWWKYAAIAGIEKYFLLKFKKNYVAYGIRNRFQNIKHKRQLNASTVGNKVIDDKLKLDNELKKYKKELAAVKSGYSFRIGRIITYVPRKVRGGIRCYKEHGLNFTLKRMVQKIKNKL